MQCTRIDLMRHAESLLNLDRRVVGGRSNATPLSTAGEAAAVALGERLVAAGYCPDAVYCTSAVRSRQTAELVSAGRWGPLRVHDGLLELSQGEAEGQARAAWWTPEQVAAMQQDPLHHRLAPHAENHAELQQRMIAALREIAANHPGGYVLAVGHGIAIRSLLWALDGGSHEHGFQRQRLENLAIVTVYVNPATGWTHAHSAIKHARPRVA